MHTFWEIIVSNSLVVTVLAMAPVLLGRTWKDPVGLHVLWVLVLLKFVTPPLLVLPVPLTVNLPPPAPHQQKAGQLLAGRSPVDVFREHENASVGPSRKEQRESDDGVSSRSAARTAVASPVVDRRGLSWMAVLTWSWAVGSALFASGQAFRILRLRRLLRSALPATPTIHRMADEIARRLGLSWTPEVLMVSVRLSPLVWSPGLRPRLVLPASLFARLDVAGQEAIVAHELAHIRRQDHWVRLLDSTTTLSLASRPVPRRRSGFTKNN
jgi:beta-lactamase regulating signal transducer with metallopeptidase domain